MLKYDSNDHLNKKDDSSSVSSSDESIKPNDSASNIDAYAGTKEVRFW